MMLMGAAKRTLTIGIGVILTLMMSGCAWIEKINTPPSYSEIEETFLENQEAFSAVTQFLLDSGYESAWIKDANGTMFVDFEYVDIRDALHFPAIRQLFGIGCSDILLEKSDNTIDFELWRCSQDIGCGVAYSINGGEPQVQFMTECKAFEEQGWYYYVADYNLWRTTNGSLPS